MFFGTSDTRDSSRINRVPGLVRLHMQYNAFARNILHVFSIWTEGYSAGVPLCRRIFWTLENAMMDAIILLFYDNLCFSHV